MELLCPAGSKEALIAAVENGADAIYLGGKEFNARNYAANFDDKELKEAVEYCHIRDVKVYLTVNTLLSDYELERLLSYLQKVYSYGVDSIIVQDLGAAKIIREYFPEFELHASTQMTIYNLEGLQALKKLGFKRVVAARELSYDDISKLASESDIELEIFVHGALCICYSGQCLISSFIGSRSGNRGKCAQPCRLMYELYDTDKKFLKKGYLLSPKDLNLVNNLIKLKKIGISSVKIEGRMKSPEYVALVTQIYRKYIDNSQEATDVDYEKLLQIYNRGGFTEGYFSGIKDNNLISFKKPNHYGVKIGEIKDPKLKLNNKINLNKEFHIGDVIEIRRKDNVIETVKIDKYNIKGKLSKTKLYKGDEIYKVVDIKLLEELKNSIRENIKKIYIFGQVYIENNRLALKINDDKGNTVKVLSKEEVQEAVSKKLDEKTISKQIKKLGGTPFEFKELDITIKDNIFFPLSLINELRRDAIRLIEKKRAGCREIDTDIKHIKISKKSEQLYRKNCLINIMSEDINTLKNIDMDKISRVSIKVDDIINNHSDEIILRCKSKNVEIVCVFPRILKTDDINFNELNNKIKFYNINKIMVGNISHIEYIKKYSKIDITGDYGLNIFNSLSIQEYFKLGLSEATLSTELSLRQIKGLNLKNMIYEVIAYGKIPLIITEANIFSEFKNKNFLLKDRKNTFFSANKNSKDQTVIYNSVPIFYTEGISSLMEKGIGIIRLYFTDESIERCNRLVSIYHDLINKNVNDKTIKDINIIEQDGFTKGHFKREV